MDKKKLSATAKPDKKTLKKMKAKEEEEKRLEEEARLKAEEEERERREIENKIAEERRQRERKINELKARELTAFYDFVNEMDLKLEQFHQNRTAASKWERYMKCDGSPDPSNQQEINTFLTLWREDTESEDIAGSLRTIILALDLINELDSINEDLDRSSATGLEKEIEKNKSVMNEIEKCVKEKVEQIAHTILVSASEKTDPETLNFDHSDGNDIIYLCMWANLSHNPRIKEFSFPKKHLSFALPRPLTLSHVTAKFLFTKFDLFSPRSRTFLCRMKKPRFELDPIPVVEEEKVVEEAKPKNNEDLDMLPPELRAMMEKEVSVDKSLDEEKIEKEEKVETVPEEPESQVDKEQIKRDEEAKKASMAEEMEVLKELSDSFVVDLRSMAPIGPILHIGLFQIPPQTKKIKQWWITQKDHYEYLIPFNYPINEPTLARLSWKDYWDRKQQGQDQLEDTMGDTLRSKKIDMMNMTLKSTDGMLESTIGANDTIGPDANKEFLKGFLTRNNEQLVKMMKAEGPVNINYKIPANLYIGDSISLARWDEQKRHWRTDEILDFKYTEETREVHFKTYHFSPYCFVQDKYLNMPFQLWRIAPREEINNCMFTLETTNFELSIEIKQDKLRLYVPYKKIAEPDPELGKTLGSKKSLNYTLNKTQKLVEPPPRQDYEPHNPNAAVSKAIEPIANKWFSLREFKKNLKSIGLNIFPEPDAEKYVTITPKNKKLEWLVYKNMAYCSCLLSFAYSKWNSDVNDAEKIVMQYQIHQSNSEPSSDNFKCMVCTPELFYLSDSLETSDELSPSVAQNAQEHTNIYHICLEDLCKNDPSLVDQRIKQIDCVYYETCMEFLESIQCLTFT